jgi:hypothetical protein
MGYDRPCELRFDGRTAPGTAVLEQKELVVRGPLRLRIPLATITEATADDGWLRIRFEDRAAEIALGEEAAKWAKRINHPPSRLDKLGVKPGTRVLVLGADDGFVDELRGAGASVLVRPGSAAPFDLIFFFVDRPESLDRLAGLAAAIVPSGAIWTLRVKGGRRDVTEAGTMAAARRAGLVDVKVVSFSDTLTAEKFVIPVARRPAAKKRARQA